MRTDRLHFITTTVFALGFVLAGSGWSFVLSTMINDRPAWSVCGQEMCSCVKPVEGEAACPLCIAGLMDPSDMECESETPTRRVPKNDASFEALGGAGSHIAIAFFVGTMMVRGYETIDLDAGSSMIAVVDDRVPRSRVLELPTPPPRA